jgi:plasmid stabilization system protein ParE
MLEIIVHEDADEELKAAAGFYETRQTGLGATFLDRVAEGFDSIFAQPLAGPLLFDDFRRRFIRQFPYSIVYRLESDRILVIAVAHWSRRPEYWKVRS